MELYSGIIPVLLTAFARYWSYLYSGENSQKIPQIRLAEVMTFVHCFVHWTSIVRVVLI
jgi:hypothetical protein